MRQVDFMEVNCYNFDIIRISAYLSLFDILRIFVSYYASFEFSKTCCNCETYCFSKKTWLIITWVQTLTKTHYQ